MTHWNFHRPWRVAVSCLCVLAIAALSAAVGRVRDASPPAEPGIACETIDWRVAAKLRVLREREDARTRAIVSQASLQREQARLHCRMGRIDDAMSLYGMLDRALTRYVQHGTGPRGPNGTESAP
jgi:hypothetical protein